MTNRENVDAAWAEFLTATITPAEWEKRKEKGYKGKPYNYENTSYWRGLQYLDQVVDCDVVVDPPDPTPVPKLYIDASGVLTWDAIPGVTSYQIAVITTTTDYIDVGNVLTYTPVANPGVTVEYDVHANPDGPWYGRVSYKWPTTTPPAPTPTGFKLGFCGNSGFPASGGSNAATINSKCIRVDNSLSDATVNWALANNVEVMGLGGPLTMPTVDKFPTIDLWEYDNEPYFRRPLNVATYAGTALTFAKAFKAKYPNKLLVLPVYAQVNSDGGDFPINGDTTKWSPWVNQLFDAQPDLKNYYDGWGAHPYTTPNAPSFSTLDKIKAQLDNKGFNKPCYVTEIGWAVSQVGEAKQAQYLDEFIKAAKTRSWIKQVYVYCLLSWNDADKEGSFGMFRPNGQARPSVTVFKNNL